MKKLLESTTLVLTAWYTLILMVISVIFSTVVFQVSYAELKHGFRAGPVTQAEGLLEYGTFGTFEAWRQDRIDAARSHLVGNLVLFNLLVLVTGAGFSYVLARRTLKPVEEAMEAQTRFSSDAAHELRTPLTVMQSEIEVYLRNKSATKAEYAALLQSNLDEVNHMRTLTDRLLMLANQHDLSLEPTSLQQVAIEATERATPLARNKRMTIKNDVGDIDVRGNAEALIDTLFILLDNAIKYSPAKSRVTLNAKKRGHTVELRVQDTGPGIDDQDMPYIFDRFYRADSSRSSQNISGHGLGLSIAKRVVAAHGGTISVRNNPKRKGATFTITLPTA